jgi:hypothetical protein
LTLRKTLPNAFFLGERIGHKVSVNRTQRYATER